MLVVLPLGWLAAGCTAFLSPDEEQCEVAEDCAARGFAEFAPLEPDESEASYRKNRRIELKLTTR